MWQAMCRLLSEHLGEAELRNKVILSGGDIHHTLRIDYGEHTVFIKQNRREFCLYLNKRLSNLKCSLKAKR